MKQFIGVLILSFVFTINLFAQKDSTTMDYVGKYTFPNGSIITQATIEDKDGVLMMITNMGNATLVKNDTDVYSIVEYKGIAHFIRDNAKKITGVVIDAMGYHLEGTKVSGINFLFKK